MILSNLITSLFYVGMLFLIDSYEWKLLQKDWFDTIQVSLQKIALERPNETH